MSKQAQEIAEVIFRSEGIPIGDGYIGDFGKNQPIDWEEVFRLGRAQ